jgi:hypothetical protein
MTEKGGPVNWRAMENAVGVMTGFGGFFMTAG